MGWLSDPPDPETLADAVHAPHGHDLPVGTYWQRLKGRLGGFGISRVADITGLDRIGFPVVQAVRPLARSNAVTQGKAATLEAAAVGAVLECLELAAAERPERLPVREATAPELWAQCAPGAAWPDGRETFVAAWDIGAGQPGAVPRDLVSTDFARGAAAERAPVLRHTIGLGAGANWAAAMMHGLLECIEADARIRAEATGRGRPIDLEAVQGGAFRPTLDLVAAAGLRVAASDIGRGGVPVVHVSVMEPPGASALPLPASGYAARFSHDAAIAAALAEAVQARLAVISGAREDITQRFYAHGHDHAELEAAWAAHAPPLAGLLPPDPAPAPSVAALAEGLGPVFAVPLHRDAEIPLAIVRVVAPDLLADPMRLKAGT